MNEPKREKGLGAVGRVSALAGSVMDLHVRIALQEMDREKRRLISGLIFLAMGGILMIFALLAIEIILLRFIEEFFAFGFSPSLLILFFVNITLAGISLRIGGLLAKGPYLPETLEGLTKTTKAVLGKS